MPSMENKPFIPKKKPPKMTASAMAAIKVIDTIPINFDLRLKSLECSFCSFWFKYDTPFPCLLIQTAPLNQPKISISLFSDENSIAYFNKTKKGPFHWGRAFFFMLTPEIRRSFLFFWPNKIASCNEKVNAYNDSPQFKNAAQRLGSGRVIDKIDHPCQ